MEANLKARISAGVVLLPLAVAAVLLLPTEWFAAVTGAAVAMAAWEWSALCGWSARAARALYSAALVASMLALVLSPGHVPAVLGLAAAYWAACAVCIVVVQRGGAATLLDTAAVRATSGWLTLVPAWLALVAVHGDSAAGPASVLLLFALVWAADIGAYFAGRRFGRTKLAPRVSPGKTWEGVAGGFAALAAVALVFLALEPVGGLAPGVLAALCLGVGAASVVGDLTESVFKRRAGRKDSGTLIPGHGGVLDRVDSITAAAPCFALGLQFIGDGATR